MNHSPERLSLRQKLREQTGPAHEAVEQDLEAKECFKTATGFTLYLRAMASCHAAYSPAEAVVSRGGGPEPRNELLLEAIHADLTRLKRLDVRPAATPSTASESPDPAEAWGIQYALEGSSMGARMLKPLSARFFDDGQPSRYLSHMAEANPGRWNAFLEALARHAPDPEAAVRGANRVFSSAREALAAL